jgi:hypothetical protein
MKWNEDWLKANRPPASQHTKKYTFWPQGRGRLIFGYFILITVLDYVVLTLFGGRPTLIAGMPLLIWITVIFAVLTIAGILGFDSRSEDRDAAPAETSPQAEDAELRSDHELPS